MKDRFLEISLLRKQIQDLFHRVEEKKKGMKEHYVSLSSSNDNHFFGLDSFRFQVKLAENEFRFLQDQFILIDNRLYCDYYKLYHHVYEYYVTNLPTGVVKSIFPIYKDLEPTKAYEPELVHKLYKDILFLIHKAYDTLDHEHRKRESEKLLTTSGIHIGNYVHNRVFTDTLIKTNIELFEQYLNTYFIYHMTFLVNIKDRLVMFLDNVLRKQPAEQCTVDEVDDNFMQVVKDTNEPTIVETFHSVEPETKSDHVAIEVAEPDTAEVIVPVAEPDTAEVIVPLAEPDTAEVGTHVVIDIAEETEEVPEGLSQSVIDVAETKEPQEVQEPETKENVQPVTDVAETKENVQPVTDVAETKEETPEPEPDTTETGVQATETPTEPTVEEVLNPIIDHLQRGLTDLPPDLQPDLQPEPKKKKRSRKK